MGGQLPKPALSKHGPLAQQRRRNSRMPHVSRAFCARGWDFRQSEAERGCPTDRSSAVLGNAPTYKTIRQTWMHAYGHPSTSQTLRRAKRFVPLQQMPVRPTRPRNRPNRPHGLNPRTTTHRPEQFHAQSERCNTQTERFHANTAAIPRKRQHHRGRAPLPAPRKAPRTNPGFSPRGRMLVVRTRGSVPSLYPAPHQQKETREYRGSLTCQHPKFHSRELYGSVTTQYPGVTSVAGAVMG
jgi:hypothetical protein